MQYVKCRHVEPRPATTTMTRIDFEIAIFSFHHLSRIFPQYYCYTIHCIKITAQVRLMLLKRELHQEECRELFASQWHPLLVCTLKDALDTKRR
jgi:hypothetical protein